MKEITDEDQIVLLVAQVVCQRIPGTMHDALSHSFLRENL